jgi:hypothetical protein
VDEKFPCAGFSAKGIEDPRIWCYVRDYGNTAGKDWLYAARGDLPRATVNVSNGYWRITD